MYLKNVCLKNYRNYEKIQLNLNKYVNIIIGNNATGKTNLLESIYVLALSKSFRTNNDMNLIKTNEKYCKIKSENEKNIFEFFIDDNSKILRINKNKIKKISDYVSNLNVIIYSPELDFIIKGTPNDRRKLLNIELSQLDNKYLTCLNEFNKILKIRNEVIRNIKYKKNYNFLEIINKQFIEKSLYIYKKRFDFIKEINKEIDVIYKKITNDNNFSVEYINNFFTDIFDYELIKDKLLDKLTNNIEKEMNFGSTLYGPHKDDLNFNLNRQNLKIFGSEGQKKSAIIAFKLAEINIFTQNKGEKPILLLDDIFSELDIEKRNNILEYVCNDIQVIITTTDLNNFNKNILKQAKIFEINNNMVEER